LNLEYSTGVLDVDAEVALPYRILIADDHNQLRETLRVALEAHSGWHVCGEAVDGLEAVQKAAELKPDAIILDLSMPVMGGLEAAREILAASPDMPILLFTNHAASVVALDAQKVGIREVISKYKWDEMVNVLESLLNEKSSCGVRPLQADHGREGCVIVTDNQQKTRGSMKPSGETVLPE
jgi:DNA-binding NarL/FixJ family response regulator